MVDSPISHIFDGLVVVSAFTIVYKDNRRYRVNRVLSHKHGSLMASTIAEPDDSEINEIEASVTRLDLSDTEMSIPDARSVFVEAFTHKKTHIFCVEEDLGNGESKTEKLLFIVYYNCTTKAIEHGVPMVVKIDKARLYFTRSIELATFELSDVVPPSDAAQKTDGWTHALVYTPSGSMRELEISTGELISDGTLKEALADSFLSQVCWSIMDKDASRFPLMKARHSTLDKEKASTIQQAWHRIVFNAQMRALGAILGTKEEQEEAKALALKEIEDEQKKK